MNSTNITDGNQKLRSHLHSLRHKSLLFSSSSIMYKIFLVWVVPHISYTIYSKFHRRRVPHVYEFRWGLGSAELRHLDSAKVSLSQVTGATRVRIPSSTWQESGRPSNIGGFLWIFWFDFLHHVRPQNANTHVFENASMCSFEVCVIGVK